jgi:DNA-binding transcriptional ArsR family regulator
MDPVQLSKIAKALADPTRLRIYQEIAQKGECFWGQLVEMEDVAPGTVSHHLKVLADADLIECRREGQFIYNKAKPDTVKEFGRALNKMANKP